MVGGGDGHGHGEGRLIAIGSTMTCGSLGVFGGVLGGGRKAMIGSQSLRHPPLPWLEMEMEREMEKEKEKENAYGKGKGNGKEKISLFHPCDE